MEVLVILAIIAFVVWRFAKQFQKALKSNSAHQMRQLLARPDITAEQRARIQLLLARLEGTPTAPPPTQPASAWSWTAQSQVEAPVTLAERYTSAESHPAIHGSIEDELLHEVTYDDAPDLTVRSIEATTPLDSAARGEGASLMTPSQADEVVTPTAKQQHALRIKALLREPKSLRDAVLVNEVLKRPEW